MNTIKCILILVLPILFSINSYSQTSFEQRFRKSPEVKYLDSLDFSVTDEYPKQVKIGGVKLVVDSISLLNQQDGYKVVCKVTEGDKIHTVTLCGCKLTPGKVIGTCTYDSQGFRSGEKNKKRLKYKTVYINQALIDTSTNQLQSFRIMVIRFRDIEGVD